MVILRWRLMIATAIIAVVAATAPVDFQRALAASDTLTVASTSDSAVCPGLTNGPEPSLRCAITDANANSDTSGGSLVPVTITFDIPDTDSNCSDTTGICTISPASALPGVTRGSVAVDGYGQPGPASICSTPPCFATPNTNAFGQGNNAAILIEVDGSGAPLGADGLQLTGDGDTVEGLAVTHFDSDSNGNGGIGIAIASTAASTVEGDYIGITPAGKGAANAVGVAVTGPSTVGGSMPQAENAIDGSMGYVTQPGSTTDPAEGVDVKGTGSVVEGNLIGTNLAGTSAVAFPLALGSQIQHLNSRVLSSRLSRRRSSTAQLVTQVPAPSWGSRTVRPIIPATHATQMETPFLPHTPRLGATARAALRAGLLRDLKRARSRQSRMALSRSNHSKTVRKLAVARVTMPSQITPKEKAGRLRSDAASLPVGATGSGVEVHDAAGVTIGPNNVISGNTGKGVSMCDTAGSSVLGNLIGTDVTGTKAIGNGGDGILLFDNCFSNIPGASQNDTIGGSTAADRNIVSGNGTAATSGTFIPGIELESDRNVLSGTTIEGNYVGTDITGTSAIPNGGGVYLGTVNAPLSGITVGGMSPGDGNVISGNTNGAIYLNNTYSYVAYVENSVIEGNLIGVDASGNRALANGSNGIHALDTNQVAIGASGSGNVISGNGSYGVYSQIETGLQVQGNDIGVGSDGHTAIGNNNGGVYIAGADVSGSNIPGSDNAIGGTSTGDGNVIAYNGESGVIVGGNSTDHTQTAIEENSIYANETHADRFQVGPFNGTFGVTGEIDLDGWYPSYPTICSTAASTTAPNDNTPCPIITGETSDGSGDVATISGTACSGCRVEVFTATNGFYDGVEDDAAQGGGQIYLGAATATIPCPACVSGFSSWSISSSDFANAFVVKSQQPVTATATQQVPGSSPAQYETSEFAQNFAQPSPSSFVVTTTSDSQNGLPCDDPSTGGLLPNVTLRCALAETTFATAPTVTFDIPTGPSGDPGCQDTIIGASSVPVCRIEPLFPLPNIITDGTTVDGYSQPGSQPNTNPVGQPDNAILTVWIDGSGFLQLLNTAPNDNLLNGGDFNLMQTTSSKNLFKGLDLTGATDDAISAYEQTTVQGDLIGVTPTGSNAGASGFGFCSAIDLGNSTYGGPDPADRNVIDGGAGDGIDSASGGDTIQGNYIGTDPTGTIGYGNLAAGVEIGYGYAGGIIGGTSPGDRNIISDTQTGTPTGYELNNDAAGIVLDQSYSGQNVSGLEIEGNYVGTDVTGTTAIPNGAAGIHILPGATSNTIGGAATGAGNLISGNVGPGIQIDGGGTGNLVQGNSIGVDANGDALGNGSDGVLVDSGTSGDEIGGQSAGAGNTIADNGGAGVVVGSSATDANHIPIDPNLIHDNIGGAIVLDGESDCTAGLDTSGRPNDFTPCPTAVTLTGGDGNATVEGDTCPGCRVEAFLSGGGGGTEFLGSTTAGSCASPPCTGNAQHFSITGLHITDGQSVDLTATQQDTSTEPATPLETSEYTPPVSFKPTAAVVSRFRVTRHGSRIVCRWRLVERSGVIGFELYAGRHRASRLIPVHQSRDYAKTIQLRPSVRCSLHVLLRSGNQLTIRPV